MIALVPTVRLVFRDETGTNGETFMHFPIGTTVTDAEALATALASVVVPITSATLVKQRIVYKFVPDDISAAAVGSTITRAGVFYFDTDGDAPDVVIEIPSLNEEYLVTTEPGAGVLIDTDNADIAAFVDLMIANDATNQFGDDIIALVTAYRQSRV